MPGLLGGLSEALDQHLGNLLQVLIGTWPRENLQCLDSSGHGKGVAREGASLENGSIKCEG